MREDNSSQCVSFLGRISGSHIAHISSPLISSWPVSAFDVLNRLVLTFARLTIFLVCIADYFRTGDPLSAAAIAGGLLIMGAFFLLSWSTYREMEEERKKQ